MPGCTSEVPRHSVTSDTWYLEGKKSVGQLKISSASHMSYPSKIQEIPIGNPNKMYENVNQNLGISDLFAFMLSYFDAI